MDSEGAVDRLTDLVGEALQRAGDQIGVFVKDRAKDNAPYRSGRLCDSIDYHIEIEEESVTIAVTANTEYAMYVEFGTGQKGDPSVSHTSKESWRYNDEEGRRHTSHGQAPHPYLRPAVYQHEDTIVKLLAGEVEKVFQ